jgi:transposase
MVSASTLIKNIINVKKCIIEDAKIETNNAGIKTLKIYLRPSKDLTNRCPFCNKCCPIYEQRIERKWRALDCGGLIVELYSSVPRIVCKNHGVHVAAVPWAFHDSGFTKEFDLSAAFLGMNINKSVASKYMRCDWKTITRCISRTRLFLEPNTNERLNGLVNIGIDETSYRKGHKYMTVVVNHDTGCVVWIGLGHSTETLSAFFELLTEDQRASIKNVSGDGARWIDANLKRYIPNATRCIDGYHVVTWGMEALDQVRKEIWHEAQQDFTTLQKEVKRGRGRPASDDLISKELSAAKDKARKIKGSTFTLGKAPENLTEYQNNQLKFIAATDPKLFRAYTLKEHLRLIFKIKDVEEAAIQLKSFFWKATHSRISFFKELAYKIRRHEKNILNTIETGLSNALAESINNKIKLFIRKAYGYKNPQNMIDMIMLGCSNLKIPLPNRGESGLKVA